MVSDERQLKERRRGANFPAWITDAARAIYLDGISPSLIATELRKAVPAGQRTPTERTLRLWAERWRADTTGPWLLDNPEADPVVVLPLLADLVEGTGGRVTSLTNAEAMILTSLGRAVPDMPVVAKYRWSRAFLAARDHEPTESLIQYLAFSPWRDRGARYLTAFDRGWIRELRSFSPDDAEWLPSGSWTRRGTLARRAAGNPEK